MRIKRIVKIIGVYALSMAFLLCACNTGISYDENKPTITVYGFDNKGGGGLWNNATWDVGTGMGEMLIEALMQTNRFNVVERLNLGDITFEQDLVTRGRVSKKTGARTGQLIGANYIARGTITEFDIRDQGGSGDINIKGISFGIDAKTAHVGGTMRIYDSTTGEIIASHRFQKKVPATGLRFGYHRGKIGGSLGGFKKTPLGKATQEAINDCVQFIVGALPLAVPNQPDIATCPYCGAEVSPNDKFCPYCGGQLGDITCPKCGEKLEPGTKFCPKCGTKVTRD